MASVSPLGACKVDYHGFEEEMLAQEVELAMAETLTGEIESSNASQGTQESGQERIAFDVVLASASPRRRQLLEEAGVSFTVRVADVDESLDPDDWAQPSEAVKKLAQRKAHAVVEEMLNEGYVGMLAVLGSDTMVALDDQVFGKPADRAQAESMLRTLSGRTHQVHTGVSIWLVSAPAPEDGDVSLGFRTFVDTSNVTFKSLDDVELEAYLDSDEPYDKAGAYAVQGAAGMFVSQVEGSLDTVIGLPVERLLREYGAIFGVGEE